MRLEVLCNEVSYPEILACIFEAASKEVDQICTPSGTIPRIDEMFIREHCNFSAIVDFPYGISETRIRVHEILLCHKRGVRTIDLVLNRYDLESANLNSIRRDFKTCYEACRTHGLTLRPVIEYRVADEIFIADLSHSLKENGALEMILGTGAMVDDIIDNIICSKGIEDRLGVGVVSCSPILLQEHYELFNDSKIHGIRIKSYRILNNLCMID